MRVRSPKALEIAERIVAQRPRDTDEFLRLLEQDPSSQDVDQSAHVQVLLAALEADAAPGSAEPMDPAPAVPPGVAPDSHSMHERIQARLPQLDRPESDYPRTLEEILAEDRDAQLGLPRRQT